MPGKKKKSAITFRRKGWRAAAAAVSASAVPGKIQGRRKRKITATKKQKKIKIKGDTNS
jgi:hypothetical protein